MKLYVFRADDGRWYRGRLPTGRVQMVPGLTDAYFFNAETAKDAEDCFDMGLSLYEVEISEPRLVKNGVAGITPDTGSTFSMKKFEVHSMKLGD